MYKEHAIPALLSIAPLPHIFPSAIVPENGGYFHCDASPSATVSK